MGELEELRGARAVAVATRKRLQHKLPFDFGDRGADQQRNHRIRRERSLSLLRTLRGIADRHGVDIATIASAAVLARQGVAAVIVGARTRDHLAANLAVGQIRLDTDDRAAIEAVLADATPLEGDVYALERGSRHGAVMKYNLNQGAA